MSEAILSGRQGPQGERGATGATGATGPQGPAGAAASGGITYTAYYAPSASTTLDGKSGWMFAVLSLQYSAASVYYNYGAPIVFFNTDDFIELYINGSGTYVKIAKSGSTLIFAPHDSIKGSFRAGAIFCKI